MPRVLGILNVTPDSFSDGGKLHRDGMIDTGVARAVAEQQLAEGADVIEVGGVSTRPNAPDVDLDEELRRVLPVVRALSGLPVWVDTARGRVADAVLSAGACGINDQRAGEDPALLRIVADAGCPYVMMHNRGTPRTMRAMAVYEAVAQEVWAELAVSEQAALEAGVARAKIILDPGLGFAKTAEHSMAMLRDLPSRTSRPVLVGASRKSFLGAVTGRELPAERLAASLAVVAWAASAGAAWVRVHDVAATRDVLAVWSALAHREGPS
jgi:dihydropteroate synthase